MKLDSNCGLKLNLVAEVLQDAISENYNFCYIVKLVKTGCALRHVFILFSRVSVTSG